MAGIRHTGHIQADQGVNEMAEITTFKQALAYLQAGRDQDDRPLSGSSTRLQARRRMDISTGRPMETVDTIAVKYHDTDVIQFHRNGTVTLDRGGYNTRTTQDRIETYSPLRVAAGRLKTTWAHSRRILRHGPDNWILQHPNGAQTVIRDGERIRIRK